jgi:hypothetical protein
MAAAQSRSGWHRKPRGDIAGPVMEVFDLTAAPPPSERAVVPVL